MRFISLLFFLLPTISIGQTLQERLQGINSLAGQFEQLVFSEQNETLEASSGNFSLLQPDLFRWHILKPEEQLFIVSEAMLLHYDVELETATVNSLDDHLLESPLVIFSGDIERMEDQYRLVEISADEYSLFPLNQESPVVEIVLSFDKRLPMGMSIKDRLRQTTVITFSALELNPALSPQMFEFAVPAGVDYFNNAE